MLLVLTSQSMAVARGATDQASEMVLCTGTGPITVMIGQDGVPVGPPHYCPDCALSLLEAVSAMSDLPHPAETQSRLSAITKDSQNWTPELPQRIARAPPVAA